MKRVLAYVDTPDDLRKGLRTEVARRVQRLRNEQPLINGVRNHAVHAAKLTAWGEMLTILDLMQLRPADRQPGQSTIIIEE